MPEQTAIANYLDEKTTKIDSIVTTINSQLEQLKELRKVLINDAVTGKIKIFNNEPSPFNQTPYEALLRKYRRDKKALLQELIALIQERIGSSRNMALFLSANKSMSLQGVKLHLFYPSDSVTHDNALFDQNIFSVVQELPYKFSLRGKQMFSFRPDNEANIQTTRMFTPCLCSMQLALVNPVLSVGLPCN